MQKSREEMRIKKKNELTLFLSTIRLKNYILHAELSYEGIIYFMHY